MVKFVNYTSNGPERANYKKSRAV